MSRGGEKNVPRRSRGTFFRAPRDKRKYGGPEHELRRLLFLRRVKKTELSGLKKLKFSPVGLIFFTSLVDVCIAVSNFLYVLCVVLFSSRSQFETAFATPTMPDFQEAMSKVRSLSYLSDEFAAFAVGLSYHGEGADRKSVV